MELPDAFWETPKMRKTLARDALLSGYRKCVTFLRGRCKFYVADRIVVNRRRSCGAAQCKNDYGLTSLDATPQKMKFPRCSECVQDSDSKSEQLLRPTDVERK